MHYLRSILLFFVSALCFTITGCQKKTDEIEVYPLPSSTIYFMKIVNMDVFRAPIQNPDAPDTAVRKEMEWAISLANLDLRDIQTIAWAHNGKSGVSMIFTEKSDQALDAVEGVSLSKEKFGSRTFFFLPPSPLQLNLTNDDPWVGTEYRPNIFLIGGLTAVEEVIQVSEGELPSLEEARPEMNDILRAFKPDEAVTLFIISVETLQANQEMLGVVNPFLPDWIQTLMDIFINVRAVGIIQHNPDLGCSSTIAFQFTELPVAIMGEGLNEFFVAFNRLQGGNGYDFGPFITSTIVEREGTLLKVILTADIDEKCRQVPDENGNTPTPRPTYTPLPTSTPTPHPDTILVCGKMFVYAKGKFGYEGGLLFAERDTNSEQVGILKANERFEVACLSSDVSPISGWVYIRSISNPGVEGWGRSAQIVENTTQP